MPFIILGGFCYHIFGVKIVIAIAFTFALIGSSSLVFFGDSNPGLVPFMLTMAKSGVKVAIDICYLANSHLFPAIFAGTAYGICNIGAKIATIFAPLIAEIDPPIPMSIFTIVAMIGALLSLFIITERRVKH